MASGSTGAREASLLILLASVFARQELHRDGERSFPWLVHSPDGRNAWGLGLGLGQVQAKNQELHPALPLGHMVALAGLSFAAFPRGISRELRRKWSIPYGMPAAQVAA